METHENPDVRPENEGQMPRREEQPGEEPTFDEAQRTPEGARAGDSSESPAEQTPNP